MERTSQIGFYLFTLPLEFRYIQVRWKIISNLLEEGHERINEKQEVYIL